MVANPALTTRITPFVSFGGGGGGGGGGGSARSGNLASLFGGPSGGGGGGGGSKGGLSLFGGGGGSDSEGSDGGDASVLHAARPRDPFAAPPRKPKVCCLLCDLGVWKQGGAVS